MSLKKRLRNCLSYKSLFEKPIIKLTLSINTDSNTDLWQEDFQSIHRLGKSELGSKEANTPNLLP